MVKRRVKRPVKQCASSPSNNLDAAGPKQPPIEKKEEGAFRDHEVERRGAAIRAMRDVEIDQLRTVLRLLRSYFKKEQLQTPMLLFFKESLPNLSVVRCGKDGQYEVRWNDKDGNLSMNQADRRNIHASLLHQMSIAYSSSFAAMPPFNEFEFASKAVEESIVGAGNLQVLEEPSYTQMLGLQDALHTPGVSSQRLSVGMTPKTRRLPKHGEMLLSVHGSPLGVYEEDNMVAIHESEEG